jgi:hypothetical protein
MAKQQGQSETLNKLLDKLSLSTDSERDLLKLQGRIAAKKEELNNSTKEIVAVRSKIAGLPMVVDSDASGHMN